MLIFAPAAFGADPDPSPQPARGDAAETESPAVSGDELQNLSRERPSREPQAASPSSAPRAASQSPQTTSRATRSDRLELDTTVVTGNRELPKVLYIVPWKKADIGDLPGQPFNTLLDEVLEPVDRDVFRREVTYFDAVTGGADATQSTSADPR